MQSEIRLDFVIPIILLILTIANINPVIANPQDNPLPRGWNFGADRTKFKTSLDNQISHHGRSCAALESIVENPPDFCTLMQTAVVKDFSGKRVKMTGFIKSEGKDVIGSMWIRIDDFGNKVFADFDNMMDRPVAGNNDWTKCEIVFDVPEKCIIFFGFILKGQGKIWVDDVSFETVNNTTDKTANNLDQAFPEDYMNQINEHPEALQEKVPANLDFEEGTNSSPTTP